MDGPLLRFHAHACLSLARDAGLFLTDPWFSGKVFNGAWALRPPPDLASLEVERVRWVWLSHTHADHFHIPSLRWIRGRVEGPLTAFCLKREDTRLRDALAGLDFEVVELLEGREHPVDPGFSITLYSEGIDSAAVLACDGRVLVDQNDCSLEAPAIERIRERFPEIDAWFYQFVLSGYCGEPADPTGLEYARQRQLGEVERYFLALRPKVFVPSASHFVYVKRANQFMNRWLLTPRELRSRLSEIPMQFLCPGDALLYRDWEERNAANLERWDAIHARAIEVSEPRSVDEQAILGAARRLIAAAQASGAARLGPREMHLAIRESGRALALDFRRGRCALIDRPRKGRLVVEAPGEELLFFLESPAGASVHFGACISVHHSSRWWRLRSFRDTLPGGPEPRFLRAARRAVGQLDRRWLGRRLYHSYRRYRRSG